MTSTTNASSSTKDDPMKNMTNDTNNNKDDVNVDDSVLYSEQYHPPWLPILIVAFPVLPFFWKYHVKVTKADDATNDDSTASVTTKRNNKNTVLSFGYNVNIFTQTLHSEHMAKVEMVDHIDGLWEWGGWGIKKNLKWQTGYIAKNGPGLKITMKDDSGGHVYVFNCDAPQTVVDLLRTEGEDDATTQDIN